MMTAAVAAMSEARTKKCEGRNVAVVSGGRAGTSLARAVEASLDAIRYPGMHAV
jgi:hypothetical protein